MPTTPAGLARHHAAGEVPPAGEPDGEPDGERLTVAPDAGEEEEYAALVEAAQASAALLAARGETGRRVVLVAELPDGADPDGVLAWRWVQAVHADTREDAGAGDDLGWYATQEVDRLLRGEL